MYLDGDVVRHGDGAQQVPDTVDEMKSVGHVHVAVVAVNKCPYGAGVLPLHEGELFAVGLEEAPASVAEGPASRRIEMVGLQRVASVEFVFGKFDVGV